MIRKLKVRNFLSFREVDLDLGPRTVLVGPNMSGKSNLISCLKFLNHALAGGGPRGGSSLERAIVGFGGLREITWKAADDPGIAIEISVESPEFEGKPTKTYNLPNTFHQEFRHPTDRGSTRVFVR